MTQTILDAPQYVSVLTVGRKPQLILLSRTIKHSDLPTTDQTVFNERFNPIRSRRARTARSRGRFVCCALFCFLVMSERLGKKAEARRPKMEAANRKVEEETGFHRTLEDVTCPICLRTCPTNIWCEKEVEGGYIEYVPPKITEWATCYYCENLMFYEVVHQEGNPIPINRGPYYF